MQQPSVVCQTCSEAMPAGAAFCANCGAPIARASQGVRISLDTSSVSPLAQRPGAPSAPILAPPSGWASAPVPPPTPSAPIQQSSTPSAPIPGIPRLTVPIPAPVPRPASRSASLPGPLPVPASRWALLQQRVTRRTLLVGLAGVSLTLGGVGWLFGSRLLDAAAHGPALDASLGETLVTYRGHQAAVNDLSWSSLQDRIASASDDGTVQVWDAQSGGDVLVYRGHTKTAIKGKPAALAVAWSPDGTKLASGGADGTAQVWDAGSGTLLSTYSGHFAAVRALAWSPDGKQIASGGDDGGLHVWAALTRSTSPIYSGQVGGVTALAWSPDGKQIAWSGLDDGQNGSVQILAVTTAQEVLPAPFFAIHSYHAVNSIAWSPDAQRVVTAGNDGTAIVWNPLPGEHIYITYVQGVPFVLAVGWSPDGRQIASAGSDGVVQVWRAADGLRLFGYRGHDAGAAVHRVVWSSDNGRIASAGGDKTVRVWSAR